MVQTRKQLQVCLICTNKGSGARYCLLLIPCILYQYQNLMVGLGFFLKYLLLNMTVKVLLVKSGVNSFLRF